MVNIKIEGVSYQVEAGMTILEAAKACGYEIPSLCAFNHGECSNGSCRVCLVEVKGARGLVASCVYPVNEGMEIIISSPKASEARRASVELLLSNHNQNCQQCDKNGKCELLHVASITGAREGRYQGAKTPVTVDELSVILPSASSAAAVWLAARTPTVWVSWVLRTADSTPSLPPLRTVPSSTAPASSAASVSVSVPPAR